MPFYHLSHLAKVPKNWQIAYIFKIAKIVARCFWKKDFRVSSVKSC